MAGLVNSDCDEKVDDMVRKCQSQKLLNLIFLKRTEPNPADLSRGSYMYVEHLPISDIGVSLMCEVDQT